MTIEIKTSTLEPVRNTFEHIKRRFGDKPASRYQEATYDVAPVHNFHYRPLWQPDKLLNDPSRTALQMEDWYAFRDPRQYYYGAYVQARAKLQEVTESNYAFFDKRGLADHFSPELKDSIYRCLIPLRHAELGANMNNVFGSAYGVGTAITQAFLYNGMDRLGIAQYLSRIGLLLDGGSGHSLKAAKDYWLTDPAWQGIRRYVENSMALDDWFEVFVAQDVVLDVLIYDLIYTRFDQVLGEQGGSNLAMLTEFMKEWYKDASRWVDSVLKIAVAESEHNKALISAWVEELKSKAITDVAPLAEIAVGESAMDQSLEALNKRLSKAGL